MSDDAYRLSAKPGSVLLAELARGEPETALVSTVPREALQLAQNKVSALALTACDGGPMRPRSVRWGMPALVTALAIGTMATGGAFPLALFFAIAVAAWPIIGFSSSWALDAELATVRRLPFPVDGYVLWLASAQPLFDVTLHVAVDHALFEKALRAFEPSAEVEWVEDHVARVAMAPRPVRNVLVGNRAAFHRLVDKVLVPLHQEVGIERIDMGGRLPR